RLARTRERHVRERRDGPRHADLRARRVAGPGTGGARGAARRPRHHDRWRRGDRAVDADQRRHPRPERHAVERSARRAGRRARPAARPDAMRWAADDCELADRANVRRVVARAPTAQAGDTVWQIDANLDDMSPELCGAASDALFAAGALDVWWTPITMKKGRP